MNHFYKLGPLSIVLFALGCGKDQPKAKDCGCDSDQYYTINHVKAAYAGNGSFTVKDPSITNSMLSVVNLCEPLNEQLPIDRTLFIYELSGELVDQCPPAEDVITLLPIYKLRKATIEKQ